MIFFAEEDAQDLTEYALLLAFVVVVCAAIFVTNATAMGGIWSIASTTLVSGSTAAAS
jgi:Flp pilus assembly pilin Flp